eukprot:scaffold3405_cov127-Cylindrotheca_fusiformis.AAC.9
MVLDDIHMNLGTSATKTHIRTEDEERKSELDESCYCIWNNYRSSESRYLSVALMDARNVASHTFQSRIIRLDCCPPMSSDRTSHGRHVNGSNREDRLAPVNMATTTQ